MVLILVCIVVSIAISTMEHGPSASVQVPSASIQGSSPPISGNCSVYGYAVDNLGYGIPYAEVTVHVFGNNSSIDEEIDRLTGFTDDLQPFVGKFSFDDVVGWSNPTALIQPKYAYLSVSVSEGNISYYGQSDNFTLHNNTKINESVVVNMSHTANPYQPLQGSGQNVSSVNGYVVDSYGTQLPSDRVTLHVMGYNYSNGQVSGEWEIYNITQKANTTIPNVGRYNFYNFPYVNGADYAFVSATYQYNNSTIYGRSDNFSLNKTIEGLFIVLHKN